MQIQKNKKSTKLPILIALLILTIGVVSFIAYEYSKGDSQPVGTNKKESPGGKDSSDISPEPSQTPSVPLPESVDPSDVKPYRVVTENETYKIRELDGRYTITLYAIVNRPDQSDAYYDQLREYKKAALSYLENHSVDTKKINITYEPNEAKDL